MKKTIFFALFLILSVSHAQTIQICQNTSIPDGFVVTQRGIPAGDSCGRWNNGANWVPLTKMSITQLGDHKQLNICEGAPQGAFSHYGYVQVKKGVATGLCGRWNNGQNWVPYNAMTIYNPKIE